MSESAEKYRKHVNGCDWCREHPLELCSIGVRLILAADFSDSAEHKMHPTSGKAPTYKPFPFPKVTILDDESTPAHLLVI